MPLRMIRVDQKSVGHHVRMRWNGIFSGAFTTLGFGFMFLLLGNAVGLSIHNPVATGVGGALRFWSWIYMAVTMIASYYLGGLVATRSNEIVSRAGGALHGLVSWGLASTLAGMIIAAMSPTARLILGGVGPNSGNWLAICIVGLGLGASAVAGAIGKEAAQYTRVSEEHRDEVIPDVRAA